MVFNGLIKLYQLNLLYKRIQRNLICQMFNIGLLQQANNNNKRNQIKIDMENQRIQQITPRQQIIDQNIEFKRQGTNLHQVQKQVKQIHQQQNNKQKQDHLSNQDQMPKQDHLPKQDDKPNLIQYGCIWGIEKFFDQKQCMKHFKKNFKVLSEEDKQSKISIDGLFKGKMRNYYVVKFSHQSYPHLNISYQTFNQLYGKNKKVKLRNLQQGMNCSQFYFTSPQTISKPAQKNNKQATAQQLQEVRKLKIQDIVASLHSLPYEDQVKQKINDLNKVIQNYNTQFFRDQQVKNLIKQQKDIQPLKLTQFIECPQDKKRTEYRSKSQFTIGKGQNGVDVVIGFNKGNYKNNTIMVESPKNVNIISKSTKLTVAVVQNFIRTNFKDLLPFDRIKQVGFWRYLIVRQSDRTNQSLVLIVCKTEGIDAVLLAEVKQKLTAYCKLALKGLRTLCFLSYNGQADCVPTEKPQILFGPGYYEQNIFDHTYQVSSSAFLQINIPMCQVLYEQIIKAVKDCDIVLDLGSGIGTIGISIKNRLPNVQVIGIEICEQAVEDCKKNCPDYQVHLGRAQDHIKMVCEQHRGKRIVAVLDPPRAGFNKDVLVALRRTRGLDNLIYVACNAKAIQDNLLQLTLPVTNRRKAPQFVIKKMLGFDLFPQTPHYQALYVLERT